MNLPGTGLRPDATVTTHTGEEESVLRFTVITPDDDFYQRLQQIAGGCQWQIARAVSLDEAERLLLENPTPLVIYEEGSAANSWQSALRRLHDSATHPCVLLASGVSDDNLLREVVGNHGYDVLPKSATREKIIRCLNFAWLWALAWGRGRR